CLRHRPQKISVASLLQQLGQHQSLFGHRVLSRFRLKSRNSTLPPGPMATSTTPSPTLRSDPKTPPPAWTLTLRSRFGDDEVYVGTPSRRMLEQGSHKIVLRPLIKSSHLRAEPDALWRLPAVSGATSFPYTPVRFVRNEKVSRIDKLMLTFDALALNRVIS